MSNQERFDLHLSIPKPKLPFRWRSWLPSPGNVLFTLLVAGVLISTQRVWARPGVSAVTAPSSSATTINYQGRSEVSRAVGEDMQVGTSDTTVVQSTITLENTSSVLVLVNTRAVRITPTDEFIFHIYRDSLPLTDNVHLIGSKDGHSSFSYFTLDTDVPPGTYTYKFSGYLYQGSGTRYVHQPQIIFLAVP